MDTERVKEAKEWLGSQPVPDAEDQMQRALNRLDLEPGRPVRAFPYGKWGGLALGMAVTAGVIAVVSTRPTATAIAPIKTAASARPPKSALAPKRVAATVKPAPNEVVGEDNPLRGASIAHVKPLASVTPPSRKVRARVAKHEPGKRSDIRALPIAALTDDLSDINADPSAIQARWTQRSLDEEQNRVAGVGAASDNTFIRVPVPQVAANGSPTAALEAWEKQKQIVDTRLQKRVSLGEKGISFDDLCDKLTKETGVTFKCSRSVADDKITLFCKARTLRDLMRQVNRIFGYVWDRIGEEPNFEYRLSQPVKNQLVEEELRNKDKNQNVVVWLTDRVFTLKSDEATVVQGMPLNVNITGTYSQKLDVVLGTTVDIVRDGGEVPARPMNGSAAPLIVLNTTGKPTLTESKAGRVLRMSGFGEGFANPDNAKNNAALKEADLFQKRVNITPEPVLPKEKLCTSAEALEAIFKATGKDVMGDYFTLLIPLQRLTQKDQPLFEALNNIGSATYHRWDWEKATVAEESDWLQFRTAGYYNARTHEVPNRLLERWKEARQAKKALDAMDLGEIALLTDPMLDSGNMAQGAELLWGLSEWNAVTGYLRPHWRAFGKLTPERQQRALEKDGIGFRQLKLDNQQELFGLISPQKRPSEFQLAGDLSAEDFWRATLTVRYPAAPNTPIFTYRHLGRAPQFWQWEVGPGVERTLVEPQ